MEFSSILYRSISRVSLVFFSRELRETTKTDIAYSSERSNATVERSKWRGNGRGKKAKRCSFPCFAFSPSPFRFFRFSVSLMKPLNTSSKRISFLGRSHFHLEPRGERKLPPVPRFFAQLKGIVPTKRVYRWQQRCRFKSRQNCIIRVSCAKIAL